MSLWRLIVAEIRFRSLNFLVGVLAVVVAVACLSGQVTLLAQHDRRTEELVSAKETVTAAEMARLEDEMRKITLGLGFNIKILPKDLNLLDFYAKDYADKFMPEAYVDRLASAGLVSINHLLPTLQQKVVWPEQDTTILLAGTRGEVPNQGESKKKPLQDAVPKGKIVLGYQLQSLLARVRGEAVKIGDAVVLMGKTFTIHKLHPRRGGLDDITAWISLMESQDILGKPGLISGMLALECNCSADRLSVIRQDIARILPDTQVEEFETTATARAEARNQAAQHAKTSLESERQHRAAMRQEKEDFAGILVPIVLSACVLWLGLAAFLNVLERRGEIGLWRALGLRSWQLLVLFLSRAMLVGFLGAAAGTMLGVSAPMILGEEAGWTFPAFFAQPALLASVLVAGPLVSALACWLPALVAVRQDPARVLQQESS